MQDFVLSDRQLFTLLEIAGLQPVESAPLTSLYGPRLSEDSAEFYSLLRRQILVRESDQIRINHAFLAGMLPLCTPDETIEVCSTERMGKRSFARFDNLATEFTELPDAMARVAFPLDWGQMCQSLAAIGTTGPQVSSASVSPFEFQGSAGEAICLSLITAEASHRCPVTFDELKQLVLKALASPEFVQPFVTLGLALDVAGLEPVQESLELILRGLINRGFILFDEGRFYPVTNVGRAFAFNALSEMTITRSLSTSLGLLSRKLHIVKMPEQLIVMSAVPISDGMQIDWRTIDPRQLVHYLSHTLDWTLPVQPTPQ